MLLFVSVSLRPYILVIKDFVCFDSIIIAKKKNIYISLLEQNKHLFYLFLLWFHTIFIHLYLDISSVKTTPDAYLIIRELSSPYLRLCPVTISTSIGLSARLSRTPGRDWLAARPDVTARSSHINRDPNRKDRLRPALHPCRASFHPQHSAPNGPPIMGNPRVFFDITIDGDNAGRIIMEVRRTHDNHHQQHQAAVDLAPVTQRYFSPICVNLAKKLKKERRGG